MALTIRLTPDNELIIEQLCKETGSPASKSLLLAASYYIGERKSQQKRITQLENQLQEIRTEYKSLIQYLTEIEQIKTRIYEKVEKTRNKKNP
jgi:predicted RNase H-like nuclease (RuvC/YqgF family)